MRQFINHKSKFWLFLPLLFVTVTLSAKVKYFIIPDKPADYVINEYKLPTAELYGVNEHVELFCLTFPVLKSQKQNVENPHTDCNLVLLSVLPDLETNSDWTEINIDSLKSDIITDSNLKRLFNLNTFSEFDQKYGAKTKYFDEYQVIKKRGNKYFTSKHCLIQFFAIRNRPSVFQNIFGTINIEQEPISIIEMEQLFKKRYPQSKFPVYTIGDTPYDYNSFDFLRDRKEYLSKVIKLKNRDVAYQFWTYTDWHEYSQNYEFERGIDRFVYVPGKGIVGGSFDFYFYFNRKKLPIKYADFMNNIKEEKIMLAEGQKT